MRIFEPHIHMVSRVTADYEILAQAGVEVMVEPAFWMGEPRRRAGTFLDYFDHLVGYESKRAAQYGIDRYVSLAVNPRESNERELADAVLKELPRYLDHPRVVGVGEIGFDKITDLEEASMRRQIEMARERNLPVQIHAPHMDKEKGIRRILDILKDMSFPMQRALVDHSVEETTGMISREGAWAGHSIYPMSKLSPERGANILQEHGFDRMMIHSAADWGPSDPLMVVHTISELRRRKVREDQIQKLVWDNPHAFFSQSGRLK
jgi:predicted metal-dependent TIM-barrel fold hydrolase